MKQIHGSPLQPSQAELEAVRHELASAIGSLKTAFRGLTIPGEDPKVGARLFELAVRKLNSAVGQIDKFCGR